jgi:hypothetical protein
MLLVSRSLQGLVVGIFALLLSGLLVPAARAQGPDTIGLKELEEEPLKKENRELIYKLIKGDIAGDPSSADQLRALEVQARFLLFRFHYDDFHDPMNPQKNIARLIRDFETDLSSLTRAPAKTSALWPIYTKAMISQGKLALTSRLLIARINVARCLAQLAALEQGDLADFYTEILSQPAWPEGQPDAVRYYMLRGLADLLNSEKGYQAVKKESLDKAARAVLSIVERSAKFLPGTSPAEIEGFRVLRREAVRALAATRLPTLSDKSHPALVLMKVMGGEGVTPPTKMDENIEGAIGLARALPDLDKDYCPDYAAQQVGNFIGTLRQFALAVEGGNKSAKLPCKVYAARLQEALEGLDTNSGKQDKGVKEYVTAVSKSAYPVLKLLQTDNPSEKQVSSLATTLEKVVAAGGPNKQLFKSLPDSILKGGN